MTAPDPFATPPGATPPPATRRVVRNERRRRPLRAGIVASALGLAVVVAGFVLDAVVSGAEVLAAEERAPLGEPIEFDAEARTYVIVLVRGETNDSEIVERAVAGMRCTVTLADGTVEELRGDEQTVAEQSDFGASVATFDAVAGPTEVACADTGTGLLLETYAVAPYRTAAKIAVWALFGAGIVAGLVGAWLIVIGLRGRAVVERVPVA